MDVQRRDWHELVVGKVEEERIWAASYRLVGSGLG